MQITGLTLWRDDQLVFKDLNIHSSAHRLGLIGANGAGKSSLLRLMHGLLTPTSGRVDIAGPTAFLFQSPDQQILFPTVEEEICFGLLELGMSKASARERCKAILNEMGCPDWMPLACDALSDGQKQWLSLMALLALEPNTLLLDEPFASLDLHRSSRLAARLWSLPQRVIVSSHDLHALASCDEVIWMNKGQLIMQGSAREVIGAYKDAADAATELAPANWVGPADKPGALAPPE